MRILVFSDIRKWEGYEELVDKIKPDVVCLAGDLTSDGFASFWTESVQQTPYFQKELRKRKIKLTKIGRIDFYQWLKPEEHKNERVLDVVESIKQKCKNGKDFLKIRKIIHVDRFYKFLRYVGKKCQVLLVKGDHDDDFKDDYVIEKINKIEGCKEISGKCIQMEGIRFLGLGFQETHHMSALKPLIENFKEKIDVVITHCEQNKVPLLSRLNPKIIIRGHFGSGKYLVNGIPSVFTADVKYTIIELENDKVSRIFQYFIDLDNKTKKLIKGSCKPWLSKKSEFELYDWLKHYHKI